MPWTKQRSSYDFVKKGHSGHAIISGGSSGIGLAVARDLVGTGWNLSLIARTPSRLDEAKQQLERLGAREDQVVHIIAADVSEEDQAGNAIESALDCLGAPDLLITSAGMAHPGYFQELPLAIFRDTMAVNYFGTLYLIKAALPAMRGRGTGRIVMISSGAGLIGVFGYTPYSPTKFALRGLAESLRSEVKQDGIGVSIVYPPDTDTPQLAAENLVKPVETRAISGTAKTWSADDVAAVIIEGIRKGRFTITPGWEMTLLAVLHSLIGPLLFRYFDRLARKAKCQERV
uniref:3-dehydrosphinganine reductase n=1 Tax=Candidatus Kentrum sp. FM TaxID=2126340 RepID=A0A450U0F8_9GAMM|nr:MAG: 3-dehydrosphinganine reductase [Candidatus Kentron sp. FM]VFJ75799.1 MAG: 3-dehydrosphinganine reductase [Candidatus Kentron sp. FM]VFK22320.1 MAG: 3-dehydrosphinganine reductase [Candidatus Kentron sp. FM]